MTTLTVTLAMKGLLPGKQPQQVHICILLIPFLVSLASIIIGRDVLLSLSAFYIRYTSLPAPVRVRLSRLLLG
jgi:cardiolipin synthase